MCMWQIGAFWNPTTWGCTLIYIKFSDMFSFLFIFSRMVQTSNREEWQIFKNETSYDIQWKYLLLSGRWKGDVLSQCLFFSAFTYPCPCYPDFILFLEILIFHVSTGYLLWISLNKEWQSIFPPPHLPPYNVFFLSTRLIYTDIHMTNYNYSSYTGIQTLSGFTNEQLVGHFWNLFISIIHLTIFFYNYLLSEQYV